MESVDSPDDLPLTGQPLAAAQQKKRWWVWGIGALAVILVVTKLASGGHTKEHGHTTAHAKLSTSTGGHASSAAAAAQARMHNAAHSPLPAHLKPPVNKECRRTRIFPFHEGCPSLQHCRSRWSGVPPTAKLFGMPVWWRLGALDGLHDAAAIGATSNNELRKDFHVEPHFVRDFVRLEDELGFAVNETLAQSHQTKALRELVSTDLFVALGYLCCVEEGEIDLSRNVLQRWVNTYNFKIALHFNHLECWHDRKHAVSSMLVADEASQRRLMIVYEAMSVALTGGAVPVIKSREMIIPFHFSLLGFRTHDNSTIEPYLGAISDAVHRVNRGIDFKVTLQTDPQLGDSFEIH